MAKSKTDGGKHRHLKARISYLYRMAQVLAEGKHITTALNIDEQHGGSLAEKPSANPILATSLPSLSSNRTLFELRSIALKSQIRLSTLENDVNLKHHICRRCSSLLQEDQYADTQIENKSRDGRKNWADVKVVRCRMCGCEKRFPIGMKRQRKRKDRATQMENKAEKTARDGQSGNLVLQDAGC